jgi:hypothetical protein
VGPAFTERFWVDDWAEIDATPVATPVVQGDDGTLVWVGAGTALCIVNSTDPAERSGRRSSHRSEGRWQWIERGMARAPRVRAP